MSDQGKIYPRQGLGEDDDDSFYDSDKDRSPHTMTNRLYDFLDDDFDSSSSSRSDDDNDDDTDEDDCSGMWCDKTGRKMTKEEFEGIRKAKYKAYRAEFDILGDGLSLSTIESRSSVTDSDIETASDYSGRCDVLEDDSILISMFDGAEDATCNYETTPLEAARVATPPPSPVPVTTAPLSPPETKSTCCCFPCGELFSRVLKALGFRKKV